MPDLSRDAWLRRYEARLIELHPFMPHDEIAEIVTLELYEALSYGYLNDPERAVDDDYATEAVATDRAA